MFSKITSPSTFCSFMGVPYQACATHNMAKGITYFARSLHLASWLAGWAGGWLAGRPPGWLAGGSAAWLVCARTVACDFGVRMWDSKHHSTREMHVMSLHLVCHTSHVVYTVSALICHIETYLMIIS